MSGSTWFTLENLKKVTGDKKSSETLSFLKKKYPQKKIIIVTEKMIGKDLVNKCR